MSLLAPLPRILVLATLVAAACTGSAGPMGAVGSNGANGVSTLVTVTPEPPGANCANGGQRIDTGPDSNGNGVLDASEVTQSTYVCNGTNGSNGSDGATGSNGADGASALVSVTPEPAGANCANGGQRVDVGIDANQNGTLDATEIDQTTYVCNGANGSDGSNGLNSLIDVTPEPAGANCTVGGQRIDVGIDTNGDGTLEAGEIQQTAYVCNAVSAPTRVYMANWAGFDATFSIYDIASNTWQAGPALPVASRGQIAADGSNVYMLGTDGNVYLYTSSSNSWAVNGTGVSLSNFAFFAAADGDLYACAADTTTLNIRSRGTWSTLTLPAPCSLAGGLDAIAHELYIQRYGTAGFFVIDTRTGTLARTVTNGTVIGENSSSAAPLYGQFYTRNYGGDILRVDGTSGTLTDTGVDPTQQHNGFAADPSRGVIYTSASGVFNSYDPASGALTSLAASPNELPATLAVGY